MPRTSKSTHPISKLRAILGLAQAKQSISQAKFAKLIGCSASAIESIEMANRRLKVSDDLADRIQAATGADPDSVKKSRGYPNDYNGRPYNLWSWMSWQMRQKRINNYSEANLSRLFVTLEVFVEAAKKKGKLFQFLLALQKAASKASRDLEIDKAANEIAIKKDINLKEGFLPPWNAADHIKYTYDESMKTSRNIILDQIEELESLEKPDLKVIRSTPLDIQFHSLRKRLADNDSYFALSTEERIEYQKAQLRSQIVFNKKKIRTLTKKQNINLFGMQIESAEENIIKAERELILLSKP